MPNPEDAQTFVNEYVGTFKRGCRDGEGQMYYANGVYDGNWKHNKRCGQGIMWFNDGALYLGEWRDDKFHGHGVLVQGMDEIYWDWFCFIKSHFPVNGNRFEGSFVDGKKNGEGIFYHKSSGQVQKGVWVDDVCQCSVMQDHEIRSQLAVQPTPYPIPEVNCWAVKYREFLIISRSFHHII